MPPYDSRPLGNSEEPRIRGNERDRSAGLEAALRPAGSEGETHLIRNSGRLVFSVNGFERTIQSPDNYAQDKISPVKLRTRFFRVSVSPG
jgi:hypothetical protein